MAPEILYERSHGTEVDVWCLGIFLYEMLYGNPPFQGESFEQMKTELSEKPIKINRETDEDIKDLMVKLLIYDPKKRLQMKDIVNHKAIQKNLKMFERNITKEDFELLRHYYYMNSGGNQLVTHNSIYARQLRRESSYKRDTTNSKVSFSSTNKRNFLKNYYQPKQSSENNSVLNQDKKLFLKKNDKEKINIKKKPIKEIIPTEIKNNQDLKYIERVRDHSSSSNKQNIKYVKIIKEDKNKKLEVMKNEIKSINLKNFQNRFDKNDHFKDYQVVKNQENNNNKVHKNNDNNNKIHKNKINNNGISLNNTTPLKKTSSLVNIYSNNIKKNSNNPLPYKNMAKKNDINKNKVHQESLFTQIRNKSNNSKQNNKQNLKRLFSYKDYSKINNLTKPLNNEYRSRSKPKVIVSNNISNNGSNQVFKSNPPNKTHNYKIVSSNNEEPMSLAEIVKIRNKNKKSSNENNKNNKSGQKRNKSLNIEVSINK